MRARWLLVIPVLFAAGATVEASRVPGDGPMIDSSATAMVPAVRGRQVPEQSIPPPPSTVPGPPQPVSGDCASWRPLLEYYGLPWDTFRPILWRESRCLTGAHNDNRNTGDHSHGALQVNRLGTAWAWDDLGFTHDYMHTDTGAIHAAGNLYRTCGLAPWTHYRCGWPNGAPSRWEWP